MEVRALTRAPGPVRAIDPDAELVAAARSDPREFLVLYDRYFDRVLGYVRLRVRDATTCEDVTSHVFTTALEQIGRFRGEGSFAGWLFQIARNAVLDVQRRRTTEPLVEERAAADPTPEERILDQERARELRARIRELAPRATASSRAALRRWAPIQGDRRDRPLRSRDGTGAHAPNS